MNQANKNAPIGAIIAIAASILILAGVGYFVWQAMSSNSPAPVAAVSVPTPPAAAEPAPAPTAAPAPAAAAPADPNARTFTLIFTDSESKQPIQGVTVESLVNGRSDMIGNSDTAGKFVIHVPDQFTSLAARISSPGRAGLRMNWTDYLTKNGKPPVYTIPLEKGATIGGLVTDPTGAPLAGARVRMTTSYNRENESIGPDLTRTELLTDFDGKWKYENAPSKMERVLFNISHPDFPGDDVYSRLDGSAAMKGTLVTTLKIAGKELAGVVLDKAGNPLAGATITSGRDTAQNPTIIQTDAQGKFQMRTRSDYEDAVTIMAAGHAPETVSVRSGDLKNLQIRLTEAGKIEGTVLKADGTPLAGVRVAVEQWRNQRNIPWQATTDANGQFVWSEAPTDAVTLNISLRGYTAARAVNAKNGEPVKVTLYPTQVITGRVVDAETKQPIDNFRMVYGIRWSGQEDVTWQTSTGRKTGNGGFEYSAANFDNGGKIRIEAEGYLPQSSRLVMASEGSLKLDFELKKGSGPGGIVLDTAGQPVAGQIAHFIPPNTGFYFSDDQDNYNDRIKKATTDEAGKFNFAVAEETYRIVVMGDKGMAMVSHEDLAKSERIQLQPWAKIEGTLRIGTKPGAGLKLGVQMNYQSDRYSSTIMRSTTADDEGRFVLDRVPPGNVSLFRITQMGDRGSRYDQIGMYDAKAGQTITVKAGGEGRPVIGKLLPVAGVNQAFGLETVSISASTKQAAAARINYPFPENYADMTEQEQRKWSEEFTKSPAFAEIQKEATRNVTVQFTVSPDGTFIQEEVRPGTYMLQATHREPWGGNRTQPKTLGSAMVEFTVPPLPNGVSDEPLDLGQIQLKGETGAAVGNSMPEIKLVNTDGKAFKLQDLRGKVVVLNVWIMHKYEMFPAIKQINEKYKDNPRLAVANLGLYMLPAWVKRIAEREALPGTPIMDEEAYGSYGNGMVQLHLGLPAVPCVILIDPEGKIAAKIVKADEIEPAVAKALGQ